MTELRHHIVARAVGAALVLALASTASAAHAPTPQAAIADAPASLRLDAPMRPLAARYALDVRPAHGRSAVHADWVFVRSAERIALAKGGVEEHWLRDAEGRVSFERVLHEQQAVAQYSAGELATLGVEADWSSLARLIDTDELARLRVAGRAGHGERAHVALAGHAGKTALRVEWSPALQLPLLIERRGPAGETVRLRLVAHGEGVLAGWPRPGERSAAYARFDAADFGDMPYEAAVRVAEAIDVRSGWRKLHAHD